MRSGVGIGLIGCGSVVPRYTHGLRRFPELEIVRCADVDVRCADDTAASCGARSGGVDELLDDPDVEIAVNLTPPVAHADVTVAALEAGKHVYVEKPFAVTTDEASVVLTCAQRVERLVGSAPDTFLGSAGQTARTVIDSGRIGVPIGALVVAPHTWVEKWHPDPSFLFRGPGSGPLLDLGPYYVATLVNLFGPVVDVVGATRIGARSRLMTAEDRRLDTIDVEVPTHASALLRFASDVVVTLVVSYDIWDRMGTGRVPIEIFGSDGSMTLPDPKDFDGDVRLKSPHQADWEVVPPCTRPQGPPGGMEQLMRGLGVVDLVGALSGEPHRTGPDLAYHVLEVLEAVETASRTRTVVPLISTCRRPVSMPAVTETS